MTVSALPRLPARAPMSDVKFRKLVVAINGAVPLAILCIDAVRHRLSVDPIKDSLHTTGLLSLIFLLLSLLVTPLRRVFGWNDLLNYRRSLGLYGFLYAAVHFFIYVTWDRGGSVSSTVHEILKRRYLQIGLIGLLAMTPLAATSFDAMVRLLGAARWKALHRLSYLAVAAGCVHYYMQAKSDKRQPTAFLIAAAVLLAFRFVWHYFELRGAARSAKLSKRGGVAAAGAQARAGANGATAARPKFWSGELRVARVFDETPNVRTFRLAAPGGSDLPFTYQPGQYLNLQLNVDGKRVNRSYTIASSPTRVGYCELTVKREEMGVSSGHLHRAVREGDTIKLSAPAGKFVFTGESERGVVLIGGGVGVTPLMSIARALVDRSWPGDIYFVFAVRTPADVIFRDELETMARRFPNFHLTVTLTAAGVDSAWTGARGRIGRELLSRAVPTLQSHPIYICGPDAMMNATRSLLGEMGVDPSRVHVEAFVSPGSSQVLTTAGDAAPAADAAAMAVEAVPTEAIGDAAMATLTFVRSGATAAAEPGQSVLEAAEMVGVEIPYECRSGICGQCKTKLLSGRVTMDVQEALSPKEKAGGLILACQAHAQGDLSLDA